MREDVQKYLYNWTQQNYPDKFKLLEETTENKIDDFYKSEIYPLFINRLKDSLISLAFWDIIKASAGGSKMGAFILCSCFIDYLAYYYKDLPDNQSGERFKAFVGDFLPNYNKENLYSALRCKLVHNYSVGYDETKSSYCFVDNQSQNHLKSVDKDSKVIVINLENFIQELFIASEKLFILISQDENQFQIAVGKYWRAPMLRVGVINVKP